MFRISLRLAAGMIAVLMLAHAAQPQSQDKALGDVAREQQEVRKQQKKVVPAKVYSDVDAITGESANSQPRSDESKDVVESKPTQVEKAQSARSDCNVVDQIPDNKPDVIIVPAGTEIRVDVIEGKVIVPVRVGFSTPIPALSKAAVQVNPVYFYGYNGNYGAYGTYGAGPVAYVENAVLTTVTVRGVTYPVQASTVPLDSAGTSRGVIAPSSPHDATFVLSAPIAIER